jgi:hypothetical protein
MDWEYVGEQIFVKLGWGILVGAAYFFAKLHGEKSQPSSNWHYLHAFLGAIVASALVVAPYYSGRFNPVELIPAGEDIMSGKMQWVFQEKSRRAYWLATIISVAIPALYGVNHGHKAAKRKKELQEMLPGLDVDKLTGE